MTDIETIKSARKPHICHWCGEVIEVGQTYKRWVCFYDGPTTTRVHPECAAAWEHAITVGVLDHGELVDRHTHTRGCWCDKGYCICNEDHAPPEGVKP